MHILFITQYYPPEIGACAQRMDAFANFLAQKGNRISILTATPSYPGHVPHAGYKNRITKEVASNVTIYRAPLFLTKKSNAIARSAHYLSFLISAFWVSRKIPKPDLIVATSPPLFSGLLGVMLKKKWRIPLIVDIRDIWPQSIESVGAIRNRTLLQAASAVANMLYRAADAITVTSPGIAAGIPSPWRNKISLITNGADDLFLNGSTHPESIEQKHGLQGKFVVLYTGNVGLAQGPEIFIATAKILEKEAGIVFLIVGGGVELEKIKQKAQRLGLKNILFAGVWPRMRMPDFIACADVCLIPLRKADTFRATYPSKLFDYMAGGKPVIINLEGEASALIAKAGCGLLADGEDAASVAEKILFLKKHPDATHAMGREGRAYVKQHFTRTAQAEKFHTLITTVGNE